MEKVILKDGRTVYSFGMPKVTAALIVTPNKYAVCAEILEESSLKYFVEYTEVKISSKTGLSDWCLVDSGYVANDHGLKLYVNALKGIIEDGNLGAIGGIG